MAKGNPKYMEYAAKIMEHMNKIFEEDSEFQIDESELDEGENMTHFVHALANVAPTHFVNIMTNSNRNHLEFNHVANQLCFQYTTAIVERN